MGRSSSFRQVCAASLACAAIGLVVSSLASSIRAQQVTAPVKIVVPYVAGSGPDTLARLIGEELRQSWHQPVVVENRPGASGNLGTGEVARARPDGLTLLLTASPFTQNVALFKSVPYDPVRSFRPIAMIAEGYLALAVHPSVAVTTAKEFVAYLKARPGQVNYASPGRGTPQHLAMELFKLATASDIKHVHYRGMPAAIRDVVGGHVSASFVPIHIALPLAKSKKIRLLAVASKDRVAVAPEVPTLVEQGISGVDLDFWFGVLAPAGTPQEFVDRANAEINRIIHLPQLQQKLRAQGLVPTGSTVQAFADFIPKDVAKWREIIIATKLGGE